MAPTHTDNLVMAFFMYVLHDNNMCFMVVMTFVAIVVGQTYVKVHEMMTYVAVDENV